MGAVNGSVGVVGNLGGLCPAERSRMRIAQGTVSAVRHIIRLSDEEDGETVVKGWRRRQRKTVNQTQAHRLHSS